LQEILRYKHTQGFIHPQFKGIGAVRSICSSILIISKQSHPYKVKNMGINIGELQPLGGSLLSGSESIMGNLRVLSEDELSLSGGGKGKGKGKGKGSGGNGIIIIINNNNNSDSRYYY
jgi:hypothetical protein